MNNLLKEAFEKAGELPDKKQKMLGAIILMEIESDAKWDELLATPESQAWLEKMAEEARAEHRAGRTKPLRLEDL